MNVSGGCNVLKYASGFLCRLTVLGGGQTLCKGRIPFPAPKLPEIQNQSDGTGNGLGNREGQPRIGKPDAGKQVKQRNETDDLPGQGQGKAGFPVADCLKENRHHQRKHCREETGTDDRKCGPPDPDHLVRSGKQPHEGFRDKHKAHDADHHERKRKNKRIPHGIPAPCGIPPRVIEAENGDDTGLKPEERNEEEALCLIVKSQYRDRFVRKTVENDIE